MTEQDAFVASIEADPADNTLRLAYADCLEEGNRPDLATEQRVAVAARLAFAALLDDPLHTNAEAVGDVLKAGAADETHAVFALFTAAAEVLANELGPRLDVGDFLELPEEHFEACDVAWMLGTRIVEAVKGQSVPWERLVTLQDRLHAAALVWPHWTPVVCATVWGALQGFAFTALAVLEALTGLEAIEAA